MTTSKLSPVAMVDLPIRAISYWILKGSNGRRRTYGHGCPNELSSAFPATRHPALRQRLRLRQEQVTTLSSPNLTQPITLLLPSCPHLLLNTISSQCSAGPQSVSDSPSLPSTYLSVDVIDWTSCSHQSTSSTSSYSLQTLS